MTFLNAGLTNGIAVVVNDSAITLYDIDELMQEKSMSHNQAVAILIDKSLYAQEIAKFGITVSSFDIEDYINKIAVSNKMTLEEFKIAVAKEQDYSLFLKETKKRLLNQKLVSKIASGKLVSATEDDIKMYYDNNIEQFKVDKNSIQVVPLEKVKSKIFSVIMTQREQGFLKEYFETLKITAEIKIIR